MKLSKSMIRLNYFFSIGFGLLMGIAFPIYAGFFVNYKSRLSEIIFIAGCVAAGIFVGLGAYLITKQTILKVIRDMAEHIQDFTGTGSDLSNTIPIQSDDELGELPRQFNNLMKEINKLIGLTQTEIQGIGNLSDSLNGNMHTTRDSVTEITGIIHDVEENLNIQLKQVDENYKAGEILNDSVHLSINHILELFSQIESLTKKLDDQSLIINNILNAVSEVSTAIGDSQTVSSENLGSLSQQLLRNMKQHLQQSDQAYSALSSFIREIEEISNRTSILAINASIEASRNGDMGDSFKIIANQVRELAGEAEKLSGEIASSLTTAENETIMSRNKLNQTEESYFSLFRLVEEKLKSLQGGTIQIKEATSHVESNYSRISERLNSIRTSLEGMQNAVDLSRSAMNELTSSSSHIKDEMHQITKDSEAIETLANKTAEQVETINSSIKHVNSYINSFNTAEGMNH